jgi:hypothetical protein
VFDHCEMIIMMIMMMKIVVACCEVEIDSATDRQRHACFFWAS